MNIIEKIETYLNEGISAGDTVKFVKDFLWKEHGDTMGWKKGTKGKVKSVESNGVLKLTMPGSYSIQSINVKYVKKI